jgi:hypothetical protein
MLLKLQQVEEASSPKSHVWTEKPKQTHAIDESFCAILLCNRFLRPAYFFVGCILIENLFFSCVRQCRKRVTHDNIRRTDFLILTLKSVQLEGLVLFPF